jgi:hypothetical protein
MNSPKEVLEKLEACDFEALRGLFESEWLDAKETPYHLDAAPQKRELAKDVTALANAGGGVIVLGFDCEKLQTKAGERINKVCPFPVSLVDPKRYSQILADLVHPPPHGVTVLVFENSAKDGNGVAAIVIDKAVMSEGPYLVGKMVDENDLSIGSYFGYFERRRDTTPPISIPRIQQQLSAGMQWASIDQRLQAIKANMASWGKAGPSALRPGITDAVRKERLAAARIAVARHEEPLVYYMANAEGDCDFPTLFKSHSERVVRLIANPPQLRQHGFKIWADRTSAIVEGRLRRNMIAGNRLLELWRDDDFIFIGEGDEDFLGWSVGDTSKSPIHINNFVLSEATLHFCWLMQWIFEEAEPKPSVLRLTFGFDNLTRPSGPATLRDAPESRFPGGHLQQASEKHAEVHCLAEWDGYDPARIAYLLIEKIYHWFGFDSQSIPFVDNGAPELKLDAVKLVERSLPNELSDAPGYF